MPGSSTTPPGDVLDLQLLDPGHGLGHHVGGQQIGGYLGGRAAVQLDPGELLGR